MRYMLDTNICIYISKHQPPEVRQRLAALKPGDVVMSSITYGELIYGASKSNQKKRVLRILADLKERIPILALNEGAATAYGEIRAHLEKSGRPIGANDLWIASHARTEGLTLVTNNLREFKRVPKLNIENWVK